MSCLPSTSFLFNLRKQIVTCTGDDTELMISLSILRNNSLVAISERQGIDRTTAIKQYFDSLFNKLSQIDINHELYLPPLYLQSISLKTIINSAIEGILKRELRLVTKCIKQR